jgi:alpha-L-arabinofuranosidase
VINASLFVDPHFPVADVNPRIFGSFVEHLGRCVYTGIFEPGHPSADDSGFRRDVLELTRELGVTAVRYPGGNFVSGFRWEDSVGPVADRPTRLDLAWHSSESNAFGLDEFVRWSRLAGVEPMMAVNLGTRGVAEAVDLLEYCNHPGDSRLSDLRIAHGAKDPYGIRLWCLGNEMDGPWQIGHKSARDYGQLAAQTARAMRLVDPDLQLIACGSSNSSMPTFGQWESEVLEQAYDSVDMISCHAYYQERDGDLASFLASAADMDAFIEAVVATADHVRARQRAKKRITISFDEWNVWYIDTYEAGGNPKDWPTAPRLLEDEYTVADAVVVGSLLISLLRHSDRVAAACLAQLVNVIGPIRTEPGGPAWRQTTFHPFALTARYANGTVLRVQADSPVIETAVHGEVPAVDTVVTHDPGGGALTIFMVNRHLSEEARVRVDLRAFPGYRVAEHLVLADPDLRATNTATHPDRVVPRSAETETDGATVVATLPPVAWGMLRLTT